MKHSSIDGELRRQGLLRYVLLLGLFFTLKGYQSLDGDQAYRLPLLLHRQDSSVYADDPFVRSFDDFNPHRGSLLVLDVLTRVLGLAPGLLFLFVLTFLTTCWAIDQIARATWPEDRSAVGIVAICLLLVAKAGNIGTNHLFEAMLLDRVTGLSLGWLAIGWLLSDLDHGWPKAAIALGLSTLIHPSLGLQFILIVSGACVVLAVVGGPAGVGWSKLLKVVMALSVAATPGLYINLWSGQSLLAGLSASDFWTLAVELQSPQHMLPHLWRMPQWLAWLSYLGLALLPGDGMRSRSRAAVESDPKASNGWPVARVRLLVILGVVLVWLAGSWVAIERLHQARFTVFQPFRMATLARGLSLVLIAGRLVALWKRGGSFERLRAVVIGIAPASDWMIVVITTVEVGVSLIGWIANRMSPADSSLARTLEIVAFVGLGSWGVAFLSRHDTQSGHWPVLGTIAVVIVYEIYRHRGSESLRLGWASPSLAKAMIIAWTVPALAFVAGFTAADHRVSRLPLVRNLIAGCRFMAVPIEDMERLAAWCRAHTPRTSRFVGPPGPKTFRLWSRRSLAFNRAGSPYNAVGLADWFRRFQDHVDVHDSPEEFVRSYLAGRHRLEARYDGLDDDQKAALAFRQGADHVIAAARLPANGHQEALPNSPLKLLHSEGRYAVYRVRPELLSHRQK